MSPEVRDAIEAARQPMPESLAIRDATIRRHYSFEHVRQTVVAVLQNVPEGMTIAELRDELEIANNQGDLL